MNAFLKGQYHLAKDIAAYIVVQLDRFSFPTFKTITMVPNYFQNPHYAIGKEVAKMLGTKFTPTIIRKLSPEPKFSLKKKCNIINHVVLLLGISMNTRQTMRAAGLAVDRGHIENLYGLTVCATLH